MVVRYGGEEIELAEAARTRYRKDPDHSWHDADVDFDRPVIREVFGVELPAMPLEPLLGYKRRLDRPVDRRDLAELTRGAALTGDAESTGQGGRVADAGRAEDVPEEP